MGLFFSPNQAAVMNSLPPDQRGAGAGMLNTFQNSATVLSMGLFFTIVTLGLAAHLPAHLYTGLVSAGVSPAAAHAVASEPPIGSLFSAFLGYNPIKELLGPTGALQHLRPGQAAYVTGRHVLPQADRAAVRQRPAPGVHVRRHRDGHGHHRLRACAASVTCTPPSRSLEELAEGAAEIGGITGFVGRSRLLTRTSRSPATARQQARAAGPGRAIRGRQCGHAVPNSPGSS